MKQTNILLITTDQQHWQTLGTLNPEISTPNLDKLAEMGKEPLFMPRIAVA